MKALVRRAAWVTFLLVACAADTFAQSSPSRSPGRSLCRAPDALTLFTVTVRDVLRVEHRAAGWPLWPIFQVPCDTLAAVSDRPDASILIVDPGFATDQEVLSYGFERFPFAPPEPVGRQPDDPFAVLGRLVVPPALSAVPTIWTRGPIAAAHADAIRLAAAAGAVQAVMAFRDSLCATPQIGVPGALLEAAEQSSRHRADYHDFFEAALREYRFVRRLDPEPPGEAVGKVADALRPRAVPGLRCDVGKRERFSLMPFGPGATSLARAAEHIDAAVAGARRGRSDLGQVNLARACTLQALSDMRQSRREPSCRTDDYGLWTGAYVPLLHAAEVKVLETSR